MLLSAGAGAQVENLNGEMALILAAAQGYSEIVKVRWFLRTHLICKSHHTLPLLYIYHTSSFYWLSVIIGCVSVGKALLAADAAVNAARHDGKTALMWASQKGYLKTVEVRYVMRILFNSAHVVFWHCFALMIYFGLLQCPRNICCVFGKVLLSAGPEVNTACKYGWTALIHAAKNRHPQIVEVG